VRSPDRYYFHHDGEIHPQVLQNHLHQEGRLYLHLAVPLSQPQEVFHLQLVVLELLQAQLAGYHSQRISVHPEQERKW
jgi:hypothetical protein